MIKRYAYGIFFLFSAFGGVWVLLSVWNLNGSISIQSIINTGPLRWILWILVISIIGLLIFFSGREWQLNKKNISLFDSWWSHPAWMIGAFLLYVLCLIFGYIFVLSPLRLERLFGYFQRWQPLFIWLASIVLGFFCLAFATRGVDYWEKAWKQLLGDPRLHKVWLWLNSAQAGLVLLGISLLIGLSKLYFGLFVDETDNLYIGWLISKGFVLYRDVFSHHFPFTYYWAALVATIFGNSFAIMRLSVLLLQIVLFAICMHFTRFYLVLGITSLVWNLINQFHRGQEMLYQTIAGLMLMASFVLIFEFLVNKSRPSKWALSFIGVLLSLAMLADPMSIYPILIAVLGVIISGVISQKQPGWREGFRRFCIVVGSAALVLCIFGINLIVSGTVKEFYRSTFWFNTEVYPKYYKSTDPWQLDTILYNGITGLDIFNPKWVKSTSPFIPLEPLRSARLDDEDSYFTWIFSNLLFRLSILACSLGLIVHRKYIAAAFLYCYTLTLLTRAEYNFYLIGFSLVSIFAAFYFLVYLNRPIPGKEKTIPANKGARIFNYLPRAAWSVLLILLSVMYFWAAFRGGYFLAFKTNISEDKQSLKVWQRIGEKMINYGCGQPVEFVAFERNPMVYFLSGVFPATKYTFMNPWVAEIAQQEVIAKLSQHESAVVWLNTVSKSGTPDSAMIYLKSLIGFLDNSYTYLGEDFWVSPELAARCSLKPSPGP